MNIEKYIKITNRISDLNKELNKLRLKKHKYATKIIKDFGNQDELNHNGTKLKICKNNDYQNISKKYLNEILLKYFKNKNQVNNLINYIYKNRFIKIKYDIKLI